MRGRWRFLFWISLVALIGIAWLAQRFGASLWQLLNMQLVGMVIGSCLAFIAMIAESRSRAIAWVVLVCWLPMALDLFDVIAHLGMFVHDTDVPGVVFLLGGLATPVIALWIALAPVPPVRTEPIARAELR